MKLLSSPTSPFVRKVMIVLHETGQLGDVEVVPVTTTPMDADATVTATNPIGKIPALIRDDAPAIYDSRVICRFLDHRAGANLYPESRIWDVLTLEATADGMLEAALLMVYEARLRPEQLRSADWVEAQWSKVDRALTTVNSLWMSHLYGRMDMGHIAIGSALSYLDLRHESRNWRAGRDALAAWHKSFSERDSMQATTPQA